MQGEKITLRKQCVLVYPLVLRTGASPGNGVKDYSASERRRDLRCLLSDMSHPHDSPCLTRKLIKGFVKIGEAILSTVRARLDIVVIICQFLAESQRQREGVLRHHIRGIVDHIADYDPAGSAVVQITVVVPGGKLTDQLHVPRSGKTFLPHRGLICDNNVSFFNPLSDFLRGSSILVICDLSQLLEAIHRDIGSYAVALEHDYFHVVFLSSVMVN